MKVALTGHRPNKLYGYDLYGDKRYKILAEKILQVLNDNNATACISGMALGADTLFALIALKNGFQLECAIPCLNHSCKWNKESQKQYDDIIAKADKVTFVTHEEYKPWVMQERNKYMVDNCDLLIAVWDGSSGGTGNCVKYAQSVNKPIVIIKP